MAIFVEFLHFLMIAALFEFTCYLTGALLLRIVTLGRHRAPDYGFNAFRNKQSPGWFSLPVIVGLLFYVSLIVIIAWLN